MMSRFGYRLLGLLGAVYSAYLLFKLNSIPAPIMISSYLADILCMPIVLSLALIFVRRVKRLPNFFFNWKHVLFAWIYFSLAFEWFLPSISNRYTADPIDMICYALGSLAFLLLQNRLFLSFKAHVDTPEKPTS